MKSSTRFNLIQIFLVMFVVVAGILPKAPIVAQTRERPRFFCSYVEGTRGAELCSRLQSGNFISKEHAEKVVEMIVRPMGLRRNFTLVPCPNIKNAVAVTYEDGVRYIVYDNDFMESIDVGSNTDWASVSIVAHEVGHHLQGHTLRAVSLQQRRENELEADEFSGSAMFRLGATLSQAQAAIRTFPDVADEENSTHPRTWRRLEAIKRGYELASSQSPPQGPGRRESSGQFTIDSPPNSSTVGILSSVRGQTPYYGRNHYVVVISLQARRHFIQQPVIVRPNGTWEGTAAFGTPTYGVGDQWSIRVLATSASLSVGEIFSFPSDAVFSNEIIVTRNH